MRVLWRAGCFPIIAETPIGISLQSCAEGGGACHPKMVMEVLDTNLATAEEAATAGIEGCKTLESDEGGDFDCSVVCMKRRLRAEKTKSKQWV